MVESINVSELLIHIENRSLAFSGCEDRGCFLFDVTF
jgi:hypothetical protein